MPQTFLYRGRVSDPITPTGTNAPGAGRAWEIRRAGSVVDYAASLGLFGALSTGWKVERNVSTGKITVTVPSGAALTTSDTTDDYECRVAPDV